MTQTPLSNSVRTGPDEKGLVGIDGGRAQGATRGGFDIRCDRFAFIFVTRGEHHFREDLGEHGALVGDDITNSARSDD